MTGDLMVAMFIGIAFGAALLVPAVQAYRGRYRSWIYRGWGTRYGAFAVGLGGAGVILATIASAITDEHAMAYGLVAGPGFLLIVASLIGFAWLPRALVPAWRQARLDNAHLYRAGDDAAPLTSTVIRLLDDRTLTVFRRPAPIVDSEYVALSVTGMHVRPRLRLPAVLSGPLPERTIPAGSVAERHGDLVVDVETVLFVQAPCAEAKFIDNWFAILPGPPEEATVSDTADGATWTLTPDSGDQPFTITVAGATAEVLHAQVQRATRPRRYRQTIHGRVSRG